MTDCNVIKRCTKETDISDALHEAGYKVEMMMIKLSEL
jgi:hypothetical protein